MMIRMSMSRTLRFVAIAAFIALTAYASAQEPATAAVHFYRYKQFQGSALKPSIYCDGIELLRMQNGRFFVAQIPVGEHTFYANDKQAGAVVKLEAGKDYYFRAEVQTGFWKGHFRLEMVMPEQGKFDETKLTPSDKEMIVHESVPAPQTTK